MEIDLGSRAALSLYEPILNRIKKDQCGTSRRMDLWGNKYETPQYFISDIKIGSYFLKKTRVREESLEFNAKASIVGEVTEMRNAGRLGRDFFEGKNLFLDFNHRIFIVCHKLKDIKKAGYDFNKLSETPFNNIKSGFVLEIETDLGNKKFVLDTGSTVSFIRNLETVDQQNKLTAYNTSKFIMNNIDFGPRKLYLLNISPVLEEIDGLLGMDFLNDHVIYLDFTKQVAYIGKTKKDNL